MLIETNKICIPYKSTGTIRLTSKIKMKKKVLEKDFNVEDTMNKINE